VQECCSGDTSTCDVASHADCILGNRTGKGNHSFWELERLTKDATTAIIAADQKKCLKQVMTNPRVRSNLTRHDTLRTALGGGSFTGAERQSLDQILVDMHAYQDGLVDLGEHMQDQSLIFPDIESNCPSECRYCTQMHNSWYKDAEPFKFKCVLAWSQRSNPPSKSDSRVNCKAPRLRMTRPWEFKTWCEVPSWALQHYESMRLASIIRCRTMSVVSTYNYSRSMSESVFDSCVADGQNFILPEVDY
jgi:hypothetical protein